MEKIWGGGRNRWSQREGSNLRPADYEPDGLSFQLADVKGNWAGRKADCARIVLTGGALSPSPSSSAGPGIADRSDIRERRG